jgi:(p)ppGpp synthase/HD superfamily hydrolase
VAVAGFGTEVLRIVEECSDTDVHPKPPWRPRKEAYLASLKSADRSVLLVSAADKLDNARAIVADLHRIGDRLWSRFNAPKDDQLWYELDRTVAEMERLGATHGCGARHRCVERRDLLGGLIHEYHGAAA